MRQLPQKLTRNGFTYTLVLRGKRSCIYEQSSRANIISYEVFIIRIMPECEIFGKIIPEREVFPGNEDFGYRAWSIRDYEKAMLKFKELEDEDISTKKNN